MDIGKYPTNHEMHMGKYPEPYDGAPMAKVEDPAERAVKRMFLAVLVVFVALFLGVLYHSLDMGLTTKGLVYWMLFISPWLGVIATALTGLGKVILEIGEYLLYPDRRPQMRTICTGPR